MFGTHHSKMMILIRHDDTAEVVIHTANLIVRDWRNMTQAVWRSPILPMLQAAASESDDGAELPIGGGERFKRDLLNYLRAYDDKRPVCRPIIKELARYDFSAVRGSLIASVPGRHNVNDPSEAQWGWSAMRSALRCVPVSQKGQSEVVVQISSIATLGPTETWLRNTLFGALEAARRPSSLKPNFKVVFRPLTRSEGRWMVMRPARRYILKFNRSNKASSWSISSPSSVTGQMTLPEG